MYAIVEIAGQQFKVTKNQKVYVHRLPNEAGSKVSFEKVMLVDDNGTIQVGAPAITGAAVEATVVDHLKGDKVIVFKKKRRKGYQKQNGHRQALTQIHIESIVLGGAKPAKKAEPKVEEPTAEAKPKKAAPKKAAAEGEPTAEVKKKSTKKSQDDSSNTEA